ncbi:BACON domain-containing protein [Bacteroides ihuae]|uniref:BACON domain-containing protein n=1 Tax=Bacteroides ihuae TaxID=1852362 RepID=UPI000AF0C039|nr:BACON domain-containing protein [Bacteroides ihuae]
MRNLNYLKLFIGLMLAMTATTFTSCVDDNDDTEAPFLEVTPANLAFDTNGNPVEGSQAAFEISTNRHWTATVKDDKSWVTLSKTEGDGSATVQVSIPENINDQASVVIQISNKVGPLMSETITIKSGNVTPTTVIYHESMGTTAVASPYPYVDAYTGWDKSGTGSAEITYSGQKSSIRSSGLANTGAYEGASGPNVLFFGTSPSDFQINKIAITSEQTNLKLTFGASYSFKADGATDYDNTFDPSKFTVSLSSDGIVWVPITYTKNSGDAASPYWVLATADFTLKQPATSLYVKFTALASSAFRLDDITLTTGTGGQQVDFAVPTITAVNPTSLNFIATGEAKTIDVSVVNQGSNVLSTSGLSGTLSASVSGTTVTVTATENNATAISQTLTIELQNGNSVTVPVTQDAKSVDGEKTFTMTAQNIVDGITGTVALTANTYGAQKIDDPATWYTWGSSGLNFTGVKLLIASTANGGGIQVQGNASTLASQGRIANVTALSNIQSMEIVLRVVTTSTFEPGYNVYAGTSANPSSADTKIAATSTDETVEGFKIYTQKFDFSSGSYSYFTIMNDLAGALYIDSIKITYK